MARSVNRVTILGNLGKDPETKFTPSGTAVSTFSVACGEKWKDKQSGEWQERTEWVNVKAWQRLAEIAGEYLRKGKQVYVEGKLSTETWEKDGVKHYKTVVVASEIVLLGGGEGGGGGQQSNTKRGGIPDEFNQENKADTFDDAPF